jgi:hypothetical protein
MTNIKNKCESCKKLCRGTYCKTSFTKNKRKGQLSREHKKSKNI